MGNNDDKQDLVFSCCDRGKTKSTPSPKTEGWTWDWILTIRKISST